MVSTTSQLVLSLPFKPQALCFCLKFWFSHDVFSRGFFFLVNQGDTTDAWSRGAELIIPKSAFPTWALPCISGDALLQHFCWLQVRRP